jgi:hypothetical protein
MLMQIMRYADPFVRLRMSEFRRKFRLSGPDRRIAETYGLDIIREHARKIIDERLSNPKNDGSQTPYWGHPVFTAQHATATCCRKCMFQWHRIPRYREMSEQEKNYSVNLIMAWIRKETSSNQTIASYPRLTERP